MPWPSKSTAMVSRDRSSVEGLDGEVDGGPDRPVDAADAPGPGRVDVGDVGGGRRFGPPMRRVVMHRAPTSGVPALVHAPVDDTLSAIR